MPAENANAELARRAYGLWNDGGIAAQVEHVWAPDVVFHDFPEAPDTGTFQGAEAVAARFQEQFDSIGEFKIELHELEAQGQYVLTTFDVIGKGAKSEAVVSDRFQHVLRMEGGHVNEIRAYLGTEAGARTFQRLARTAVMGEELSEPHA